MWNVLFKLIILCNPGPLTKFRPFPLFYPFKRIDFKIVSGQQTLFYLFICQWIPLAQAGE